MNFFNNLPTWFKWALVIALGIVLFAAGLTLGLGKNWIFLVIIVVLLVLFLGGYLVWTLVIRPMLKSAKFQKKLQRLLERPEKSQKRFTEQDLEGIRKKWQEGIAQCKKLNITSYGLPWYLVIGPSGSGKTEGIRRGKLPNIGPDEPAKGKGGTSYLDFWFTTEAVMVDTAGKLAEDENEQYLLKELLGLLKVHRPASPINGLLLIVPAKSLIPRKPPEPPDFQKEAENIRIALVEIRAAVGLRFPVYVVVTMCDLLNGFREFFESIGNLEVQHQVLGWSNPEPLEAPFDPKSVGGHLSGIAGRLKALRLGLLQNPRPARVEQRTDEVDKLYVLPHSFAALTKNLQDYLGILFGAAGPKGLFFRGIYFTSALREGEELDAELVEKLRIPFEQLRPGRTWDPNQAYFWRDLVLKKMVKEQGLVTPRENVLNWLQRWHWAIFGSGAIALVICLIFAAYHQGELSRTVEKASDYLEWATNGWSSASPSWNMKGEIWQPIFGTNKAYAGDDIVHREVSLLKYHERLRELAKHKDTSGIFKLAELWYGTVRVFPDAQAIVFEASVMDPIVGVARQKMIEDAVSGALQSEGEGYRQRQINALRDLIVLEAGIQGTRSEINWEQLLDRLAEYVREGNRDQSDPTGRELTDCLTISSSITTWPGKHLSAGSSLNQNKPIEAGLAQLNDLLKQAIKRDKKEKALTNLLAALEALNQFETSLTRPARNTNSFKDRFNLYDQSFQRLMARFQSATNGPDGLMWQHPYSLSKSLEDYRNELDSMFTNRFGALSITLTNYKDFQLLRDIRDQLAVYQNDLSLPFQKSEVQSYDANSFGTNSPDGKHLFEIRHEIHQALQEEQLGFPLVNAASDKARALTAADVLVVRRAVAYMRTALYQGSVAKGHYNLVSEWKPLCDKLESVVSALVEIDGKTDPRIGTCEVTFVANTNNKANKWRSVSWNDPENPSARLRTQTDRQNVPLGKFQLDRRIDFLFGELANADPSGKLAVQDLGPWPLIRLFLKSGKPVPGAEGAWEVTLPVLFNGTEDFSFQLILKFITKMVPRENWPNKSDLRWPGETK